MYKDSNYPWDNQENPFVSSTKWVDPRRRKSKGEYPYSYDAFYIWRDGNLDGCSADYHDRMMGWDCDKFKTACIEGKRFSQYTKADCSKFLSTYFGQKTIAAALVEGCNASNGYPYWVFYYKLVEEGGS